MKMQAASGTFAGIRPFIALCLLIGSARSEEAFQATAPAIQDGPENVLRAFLRALAREDIKAAHALVAPSTREEGDPIAYLAKADFKSFAAEAAGQPASRFGSYRLGEQREETKQRMRIFVHFNSGDNDETLLIREAGRWWVADPIHIIR